MSINILVVDDSKLVHAMIEQTLEMAGIEIAQHYKAMNGAEGLAILRSHPVDLIFSDIHMPEMDGVEMIRTMMKEESLKIIPIVVISSEGSKKRIDELKEIGVQHFIRKPFTPEIISEVVLEITGEQNG